eukprot:4110542-Pleurochrysis_carterae.AAC.1
MSDFGLDERVESPRETASGESRLGWQRVKRSWRCDGHLSVRSERASSPREGAAVTAGSVQLQHCAAAWLTQSS